MDKEEGVFVRITNKDIYAELKDLQKITSDVLSHAKKTNGRVSNLEEKSIGLWISNNYLKFIIGVLGLVSLTASQEIVSFLKVVL